MPIACTVGLHGLSGTPGNEWLQTLADNDGSSRPGSCGWKLTMYDSDIHKLDCRNHGRMMTSLCFFTRACRSSHGLPSM